MSFDLSSITSGPTSLPWSVCVHGRDGIGKSTLANTLDNPIFLPTEPGLDRLDVKASFPVAQRYQDVLDALNALYDGKHDYKWLVIDSIDWAETLIADHIAKQHGWQSIGDADFGKGYAKLHTEFCEFLRKLDKLRRAKGMGIFMTCHTITERYDDPTRQSYDRYCLKLRNNDKTDNAGKVKEFCDLVGYLDYNVHVKTEGAGFTEAKKAQGATRRELHTQISPSYDAKCRFPGVPGIIEVNQTSGFAAVINAVETAKEKHNA